MNQKTVEKIFSKHNLGQVNSIEKIEIGFTNEVYSVNNEFIFKVCKAESNEDNFQREKLFYDFFKGDIPVPEVTVYDDSKQVYERVFMVYPKIEGDNLYAKWHLMDNKERRDVVRQLCEILKVINLKPYENKAKEFGLNLPESWCDVVCSRIQEHLGKVREGKLLPLDFIEKVGGFVEENQKALSEQKIALVYWDIHFDNVLVKGSEVVGILDFERTELASIDFVLDVVKRMVDYPKKYMAEEYEKFAKVEDYAHLMDWFKEFYPGLFSFKHLKERLALYSIEHDLKTLLDWHNSGETQETIEKVMT
ncbi:MAG: aminoglycoside phosphotransferase family protein [Patescibacteria group bacterium]